MTTQDAVHRGILLSIVGAINEISHRHPNFEVIMTGGDAAIISQHVNRPVRLRDDLLLNGLARYFDHTKQS
jgi:type III pantothenate kinase